MAIVEAGLSGCYHNLIFDKFLQLRYQIPVKRTVLLQRSLPIAKHSANLMGFKRCLRRTFS